MIFELAQDFHDALATMPRDHPKHRMLELLEEAIRRDIHFIARHPTTLFQCMWNTVSPLSSPTDPTGLPGLMQSWLVSKSQRSAGFPWIRSVRPPMVPLGSVLAAVWRGHTGEVRSVAVSPDGCQVVSAGDYASRLALDAINADDTYAGRDAAIWDARTGAIMSWLHQGEMHAAAFMPDGRHVILGGARGLLLVWDMDTSTPSKRMRTQWDPEFLRRKGEGSIMTHDDVDLHLWDSPQKLRCEGSWSNDVYCVACAPDGTVVASGHQDEAVRLWRSGQDEPELLRGHHDAVRTLAFSRNGEMLASGSARSDVILWNTLTGKPALHTEPSSPYKTWDVGWNVGVAFSSDSACLAVASKREVRIWDTTSGVQTAVLCSPRSDFCAVAFLPDGRLLTGSTDGAIRLWDPGKHEELACLTGHENSVLALAVFPDGQRIVSGSSDRSVRVWRLPTTQATSTSAIANDEATVRNIAFSASGERIHTGVDDQTFRIWDTKTGKELLRLVVNERSELKCLAFSQDDRVVAYSVGKTLLGKILDRGAVLPEDPKAARRVKAGHTETPYPLEVAVLGTTERLNLSGPEVECRCVALSGDSRMLAAAAEREIWVWNLPDGKQLDHFTAHGRFGVARLAFCPHDDRLVSGGCDGGICVWTIGQPHEPQCIGGHEEWVTCLAFSSDGSLLATGSEDRSVRVWRYGPFEQVCCLENHTSAIVTLRFDGNRWLISTSRYEEITWDLENSFASRVRKSPHFPPTLVPAALAHRTHAAVPAPLETAVVEMARDAVCGWFPLSLAQMAAHPYKSVWAGTEECSRFLHLISLECGNDGVKHRDSVAPATSEEKP